MVSVCAKWVHWGRPAVQDESRTGSSAYSTAYTLDGEGRRTSQGVTVGGSTATTAFILNSDDELTSTSSSTGGFTNSYSYNDNGEQIGRTLSGTSYSQDFDYDGQMTSTTGASTVSYAYDAIGRRVSRTAGGTTTAFQYSGDNVLLEKQGATTTATYTYGNALIGKDGETPLYDGLGSARAETNSSQAVTFTQTADAFGNAVASTGSTASSYGFAATSGYRNDGDAGLSKVGARYYDSQAGTFTTRDTYLDQMAYLYCEHDPVNGVDPRGHMPDWWPDWLTGGGMMKIVVGVGATISGTTLVTYIVKLHIVSDGNYRRHRMVHDWVPNGDPPPEYIGQIIRNGDRDDISVVAQTANAAGQTIYRYN